MGQIKNIKLHIVTDIKKECHFHNNSNNNNNNNNNNDNMVKKAIGSTPSSGGGAGAWLKSLYTNPQKWQIVKHTAIFAFAVVLAREFADIPITAPPPGVPM